MNKYLITLLLALPFIAVSCSDDDDPVDITIRLNQTALSYTEDGVWDGVATNNDFQCQNVLFQHTGEVGPWGLVWNGFTPSRVSSTDEQENWLDHQFQILTGGGMSGKGTPYIIAFWNNQENSSTPAEDRSCRITYRNSDNSADLLFRPISVYVQNTAYTYYTMLNGNNFSTKFGPEDYLILHAYGIHEDNSVSGTSIYLAQNNKYLTDWTLFNLASLGEVKELYFTMESSDSGQWGMNTPSYFAMDCLTIRAVLPD